MGDLVLSISFVHFIFTCNKRPLLGVVTVIAGPPTHDGEDVAPHLLADTEPGWRGGGILLIFCVGKLRQWDCYWIVVVPRPVSLWLLKVELAPE